jgi:RNA polymerase sigma-70 factor (ECF subfamily)
MHTTTDMTQDTAAGFADLMATHQRLVYRIAGSYAWNRADIDDLVQEIATQAWRAYPSYDPQRRFSTWLYRVALNVAISWLRSEGPRRRQSIPYEPGLHEPASHDDHESDDGARILRGFIESQAPLDRAVLLLYLEDRPLAEIAEILGITTTHLTTKINRLKQKLAGYAEKEHGTR